MRNLGKPPTQRTCLIGHEFDQAVLVQNALASLHCYRDSLLLRVQVRRRLGRKTRRPNGINACRAMMWQRMCWPASAGREGSMRVQSPPRWACAPSSCTATPASLAQSVSSVHPRSCCRHGSMARHLMQEVCVIRRCHGPSSRSCCAAWVEVAAVCRRAVAVECLRMQVRS